MDADTVVFVADPNTGNILNFNVGENVDFKVPRVRGTLLLLLLTMVLLPPCRLPLLLPLLLMSTSGGMWTSRPRG